jgi:hypothetical protein
MFVTGSFMARMITAEGIHGTPAGAGSTLMLQRAPSVLAASIRAMAVRAMRLASITAIRLSMAESFCSYSCCFRFSVATTFVEPRRLQAIRPFTRIIRVF